MYILAKLLNRPKMRSVPKNSSLISLWLQVLHCQPQAGLPFFPFLSELPMPDDYGELEEDKQVRLRACQGCTTSLINQWTVHQRDKVPIEDRAYVYDSPLGMD